MPVMASATGRNPSSARIAAPANAQTGGGRSRNNSLLVCLASHTRELFRKHFQQRREVIDHRIRRERRADLANGIDDNPVLGLVRDCQCEAVIGAAARISARFRFRCTSPRTQRFLLLVKPVPV